MYNNRMALYITHKDTKFGIGDRVKVTQKIIEGGPSDSGARKTRSAYFEGIVISISGRGGGKTFTVRRIGEQKIGIERIFPIELPSIEKIEIIRRGTSGVRRSKLYYLRHSSPKEIEQIYTRSNLRNRIIK